MARFRYQAVDADGKPISGEMEAADVNEVTTRLEGDDARVESVEPIALEIDQAGRSVERMKVRDFRQLSGQIGEITEAGLPLVQGLAALAEELPNSRLRRGLRSIVRRLAAGGDLASVLKEHGGPPELQALIAAGVRTGHTGELLGRYAAEYRQVSDVKLRSMMALAYPAFMLGIVGTILLFILLWIVPMFRHIFDGFGTQLPAITLSVLFISDLLIKHGLWVLVGLTVVAGITWGMMALLVDDITRRRIFCAIPIIGRLLRFSALARFSHLLAILVENHVPLPEALTLSGESVADAEIRAAGWIMAADVDAGESLDESALRLPAMPATLVQAMAWHKQPDVFADTMRALAEMFESRARAQTGLIAAVCQPAVILFIGIVLGYTVIALFMPLIKLLNDLS
jgi:type II secretory pathway component PulF